MTFIPNSKRLQELSNKWLKGTISETEQKEFNEWFSSEDKQPFEIPQQVALSEENHREKILKRIHQDIKRDRRKKIPKLSGNWIAAAAVLLIIVSTGLYFYRNSQTPVLLKTADQSNIVPGGNKAILILADGRKISLTDADNGELAEQAGVKITKLASGEIIYAFKENKEPVNAAVPTINTIETPKGGQYQVNLPDGTKVWLNAASSISFPVVFSANERRVSLSGEAYFEVAKNKAKPFKVAVRDVDVQVLGTHFNVKAYTEDGEVRTTLLEGSVRLNHKNATAILKPGEQGYVPSETSLFNISEVNVASVTAWKDGLFLFENTPLRSLMGQISRWYNVDVVYEAGVKDDVFFGKIERKSDLNKVLKILELGDVHFKIEGRKLIVKP